MLSFSKILGFAFIVFIVPSVDTGPDQKNGLALKLKTFYFNKSFLGWIPCYLYHIIISNNKPKITCILYHNQNRSKNIFEVAFEFHKVIL